MRTSKRRAAVWPLRTMLRARAVRRRLAFALRQDYFDELQITLPLSHGLSAPLDHHDAIIAFSETFFGDEYGALAESIELPGRWIDFGAHRGYFSLWLAWQRLRAGKPDCGEALLVDADPRAAGWISRLCGLNPALSKFRFLHAAAAPAGDGDNVELVQRAGMGSSRAGDVPLPGDATVRVPRLRPAAAAALLGGPYDLIKVDIEGAEFALFETAGELLRHARQLVLEWHEFGREGASAAARAARAARALGFGAPVELRPPRAITVDGRIITTGTQFYRRHSAG